MTSTLTILAVDDDEGHIELLRRNLRRAGVPHRFEAQTDASLAWAFIERTSAASSGEGPAALLIMLDINMPGALNGLEVLRRVKSTPATRDVPVVMLTTTDDPREVERCYALGCNVYLTKPVEPAAFAEAMGRLGLDLPRGDS